MPTVFLWYESQKEGCSKIFSVTASMGMCWMLGSCSTALHTTWCVLWSDFHQPTESPMSAESTCIL